MSLTFLAFRALLDEAEGAAVPPGDGDGFVDEAGGEDDGEMGAAVEAHADLAVGDGDVGGHVDEVAEDLARLSVIVAAHAAGHQAIEAAGDDQQRHVEVDLEADRRGERVDVEEAHRVGERVLDQHALGIAGDDRLGGGLGVIGEQDGGLVVAEIGDEELAEVALVRTSLLFVDARGAVLAAGDVEVDGAPGRWRQAGDLGEQARRAPAQGDEGDAGGIEPIEAVVGGELGVEDEVPRQAAVLAASRMR